MFFNASFFSNDIYPWGSGSIYVVEVAIEMILYKRIVNIFGLCTDFSYTALLEKAIIIKLVS